MSTYIHFRRKFSEKFLEYYEHGANATAIGRIMSEVFNTEYAVQNVIGFEWKVTKEVPSPSNLSVEVCFSCFVFFVGVLF